MTKSKKEKYYSIKSPDQEWDALVIGSGMGGMCTAALLSKLGYKVLVLEQHYVPGGFTHSFRRKQWVWDVGVHAVGEVTTHTMIGRLLAKLTDQKLEWETLGPIYEEFYYPDNFRLDFPDNPQQFRQNLVDSFPEPEDVAAIDAYLDKVREVSRAMKSYYLAKAAPPGIGKISEKMLASKAQKFFELNTAEFLNSITDNPNLKTVLSSQWGYYGSPPSRSSFAIQALVSKHFKHGAFYPIGGSHKIAECLLETVVNGGGWTRIMADVKEIVIEKNKAVGVRLGNGEVIKGKKIISGIGAIETVTRLLDKSYQDKEWVRSITSLKPSSAHLCLNIGFKGDISKAGASAANKWFWETWDSEFEEWDILDKSSEAPVLYTSFPSLKDPLHDAGDEELHTGEVVTFVPYEAFSKWTDQKVMRRDEDYQELKEDLTNRMLQQLLKHMPELEPMIAFRELSTPLSTEYFTRPVSGAIYGIEPTPERFRNKWLRPATPIKNFFLSGSDIATVGVIGAMVGGILAAVACEPLKAIKYTRLDE